MNNIQVHVCKCSVHVLLKTKSAVSFNSDFENEFVYMSSSIITKPLLNVYMYILHLILQKKLKHIVLHKQEEHQHL